MAAVANIVRYSALRRTLICLNSQSFRTISTSKKNRETASVADTVDETESCAVEKKAKKNWMSYGFDHTKEEDDRNAMHSSFFFSVTLCLVVGGFILTYLPDTKLRDWAQREAYLEIRRREKLGLPHVDPNLINPKKIKLPSDHELGDQEAPGLSKKPGDE